MAQNKSMQHWNAHQMCVFDVETTGLKPCWHEIVQIAVVALDANLQPRRKILPFEMFFCPEHPERIDPEAMRVTGLKEVDLLRRGHDPEKGRDLFEQWVKKLELDITPSGTPKRIIPLAHNWAFDKVFIQDWLGASLFNELIDSRYRDTMTTSLFLNDAASFHAEKVPYSKNTLQWLCKRLGVENPRAHDAIQDCLATAECYRRLCQLGVLA